MPATEPAAARPASWRAQDDARSRPPAWLSDKYLGTRKSWMLNTALFGAVTTLIAPAIVLLFYGWPAVSAPHVLGCAIGGVLGGLAVGATWHAALEAGLRDRGIGLFVVFAIATGALWGLVDGGLLGPGAVALMLDEPMSKYAWPLGQPWWVISAGPSVVAAAFACAWFAPALVVLKVTRRRLRVLHVAGAFLAIATGWAGLFAYELTAELLRQAN